MTTRESEAEAQSADGERTEPETDETSVHDEEQSSDDGAQSTASPAPDAHAPGEADDAEARYEELSRQYVRLVADFDNFRRRTRENEAAVRERAAAALITELLPVLDNLQLALDKAEDATEDSFGAGVVLIQQQLQAVLSNHGLQPLETAGQPFDPNTMEAVAQMDGQGRVEPGHVLEQLRRGYTLHGKVLRVAQVVVAEQT